MERDRGEESQSDEGSVDETRSTLGLNLPVYTIVPSQNTERLVLTLRRQKTDETKRKPSPDSSATKKNCSGMLASNPSTPKKVRSGAEHDWANGLKEGTRLTNHAVVDTCGCGSPNGAGESSYLNSHKRVQADNHHLNGSTSPETNESKDGSTSSSTSSVESDATTSDE